MPAEALQVAARCRFTDVATDDSRAAYGVGMGAGRRASHLNMSSRGNAANWTVVLSVSCRASPAAASVPSRLLFVDMLSRSYLGDEHQSSCLDLVIPSALIPVGVLMCACLAPPARPPVSPQSPPLLPRVLSSPRYDNGGQVAMAYVSCLIPHVLWPTSYVLR